MNFFKKPHKFGSLPAVPQEKLPAVTNVNRSGDTLHELNEQIGRRHSSLYTNPGEKLVKETGTPSYFTGIKRLLRTRYGGGSQF